MGHGNRFVPKLRVVSENNKKNIKIYDTKIIYTGFTTNKCNENELLITKKNSDTYTLSINKLGESFPISAPYSEMQAEYDIFSEIYNGFSSFVSKMEKKEIIDGLNSEEIELDLRKLDE